MKAYLLLIGQFIWENRGYVLVGSAVAAINAMSAPNKETGAYAYVFRFLHGLPFPTKVGAFPVPTPNPIVVPLQPEPKANAAAVGK